MDDTFVVYSASNYSLKGTFCTIRDNLRIYFTIPLQDTESDGFSTCSTTPFAFDTSGTKVRFINFYNTLKTESFRLTSWSVCDVLRTIMIEINIQIFDVTSKK